MKGDKNMKKWIALLLCLMMLLALTACTGNDDPTKGQKNDKSFADVQKELRNIIDSDDKSDIEKNIKKVFGISISLPSGSEYDAEVMELSIFACRIDIVALEVNRIRAFRAVLMKL